jgi:hypothetical protein
MLSMLGKTKLGNMFNAWDLERAEYRRLRRSRYIYRIDLDVPARRRKTQRGWFVARRLSRLFYLTLSYSQFRKLATIASKREGSWESSFIMLVENRVIGMLYRMQIHMNVFELRWFVLTGKVFVNNKKITYYNALVDYFKILRFNARTALFTWYIIVERFKAGFTYFSTPRYMCVSYNRMLAFVFREPKRVDLVFPIKIIDVYRSADYY